MLSLQKQIRILNFTAPNSAGGKNVFWTIPAIEASRKNLFTSIRNQFMANDEIDESLQKDQIAARVLAVHWTDVFEDFLFFFLSLHPNWVDWIVL